MNRLLGFPEKHTEAGVAVSLFLPGYFERDFGISGVRQYPAEIAGNTGGPGNGAHQTVTARLLLRYYADSLHPVQKAAGIAEEIVEPLEFIKKGFHTGGEKFALLDVQIRKQASIWKNLPKNLDTASAPLLYFPMTLPRDSLIRLSHLKEGFLCRGGRISAK